MDRGPSRRVVYRVLWECLSRLRGGDGLSEEGFAAGVADLPGLLREMASLLEAPESLETHAELPGLSGYSLWAATYDDEPDNQVVAREEAVIWNVLGPCAGRRVLDVGCGTGRHALRLAAEGAEVVGLEPTPEMLARARAKAERAGLSLDLRAGGVDDLGAALGEFDLVLCCLVLSHVADLDGAMAKLAGRVRPGGRLVVSDFHPVNLLLGARTSLRHEGTKYIVPNFLRLPSDYFGAMRHAGLQVTRFLEPAGVPRYPGLPITLVLEAQRSSLAVGDNAPPSTGSLLLGFSSG